MAGSFKAGSFKAGSFRAGSFKDGLVIAVAVPGIVAATGNAIEGGMEDGMEDGIEGVIEDGMVPVSIVSVMAAPAVMASVIKDFGFVDSFQGEPGLA